MANSSLIRVLLLSSVTDTCFVEGPLSFVAGEFPAFCNELKSLVAFYLESDIFNFVLSNDPFGTVVPFYIDGNISQLKEIGFVDIMML